MRGGGGMQVNKITISGWVNIVGLQLMDREDESVKGIIGG